MKNLLHVGCGPKSLAQTTPFFNSGEWQETRFDIDPAVKPDIVGSLTDMSALADASMDAVFSSHNIEHLFAHEVAVAIAEMRRVLRADGIVVITCPDLRSIAELITKDLLLEPAYSSPAGPISALDMLYGHRASIARGNTFMAHRCGFTLKALMGSLRQGGFESVAGTTLPERFELWAVGTRNLRSEEDMKALLKAQLMASI
ncbi:MAG: hypothetical protein RIR70_1701 [Pseudomonadota bacterium]|jgi:SAM-dependent methyltransferase